MALPQTSKEKSARVDWGYHARPSPTTRTRRRLWALALLLVAGPAVAATVAAGLTDKVRVPLSDAASRGELASVHAAWDTKCEACHEPFTPITGESWLSRTLGRDAAAAKSASNARCETCHSGGPHHASVRMAEVVGCAECHRDHRGRDASLVHMADAICTRCHADLVPHHAEGKLSVADNITGFAGGHPEFRAVAEAKNYKRTLKFSHAVHMAPGLNVGSGSRYADIADEKARAGYMALAGVTDPNAKVQLDCAACHQLDAGRVDAGQKPMTTGERFAASADLKGLPRDAVQPPRAAGAYFLPVDFDAHCKACHPLSFDESPGLRGRQAPHRVQPDDVERYLTEVYAARYFEEKLGGGGPDRAAGRLDNRPADLDAAGKADARKAVAAKVDAAKRELLVGKKACAECHYTETKPGTRFPSAVTASVVPVIWEAKAKFDHTAHRAVNCQSCHPGSYRSVGDEKAAVGKGDPYQHAPDLPAIDSCRQCHSPAKSDGLGAAVGGVRHGCTDCHSYHNADHRLHGPGSPLRLPSTAGTAEEFLRGRK